MRMIVGDEVAAVTRLSAVAVDLQPGDGTYYRFVVSRGTAGEDAMSIAVREGVRFEGYEYSEEEVRSFFGRHGAPKGREDYRQWADRVFMAADPLLGYVMGHSAENPWTALAALLAMRIAAGCGSGTTGVTGRFESFPACVSGAREEDAV